MSFAFQLTGGAVAIVPDRDGIYDLTPANTRLKNIDISGVFTAAGGFVGPVTATTIVFTTSATSPAGFIALGAAPPATGAIRVDATSYGDLAMHVGRGAVLAVWRMTASAVEFGTTSADSTSFIAGGASKWMIAPTAVISSLQSSEVTARIVGGSTNGLSIRNSGNTRDNFLIADAGTSAILTDGTRIGGILIRSAASGEVPASTAFVGNAGTSGVGIYHNNGTAGQLTFAAYYDGAGFRTVWEIANTAGPTFGNLLVLKSGGNVAFVGGSGSFGGGSGVFMWGNAVTAPTTNPVGGSLMYAAAGATVVRGSGGSVTTIAPA